MSSTTQNLGLFKYNTATDGSEVFSIDTAMNENWDKIDSFATAIKSLSNLDAVGEKRFSDINTELGKKLEAQVLLAENGYIKFNNNLRLAWICWSGSVSLSAFVGAVIKTVTYPITFTQKVAGFVHGTNNINCTFHLQNITLSNSTLAVNNTDNASCTATNCYILIYGY